jgi:penicillin amidase
MARWIAGEPSWYTSGAASYLQVIDVGEWDNSVMVNLPGQSNDPRSPHYADQYRPWIEGQMLPMLFSRVAVEAAAVTQTTLLPAHPQP